MPRIPRPTTLLLCPPEHFAVIDVKNRFMREHVGGIDSGRARAQWDELVATYRRQGLRVELLPAEPGREDMVFTANGAVVLPRAGGGADVVLSRMRHASRQAEVPALARWLVSHGLRPHELPASGGHLEGHGDVLVVPGRRLLLGGHGGRSEASALQLLASLLRAPLVELPLVGEPFYHLDTCLALLDEDTALLHPPAFLPQALERLGRLFPRLIEADAAEAEEQLACNAHALPNGVVLLPARTPRTAARLEAAGYRTEFVDVSEFHKSGGSIFCLKLELPTLV